jgi:hypothetical protein
VEVGGEVNKDLSEQVNKQQLNKKKRIGLLGIRDRDEV